MEILLGILAVLVMVVFLSVMTFIVYGLVIGLFYDPLLAVVMATIAGAAVIGLGIWGIVEFIWWIA